MQSLVKYLFNTSASLLVLVMTIQIQIGEHREPVESIAHRRPPMLTEQRGHPLRVAAPSASAHSIDYQDLSIIESSDCTPSNWSDCCWKGQAIQLRCYCKFRKRTLGWVLHQETKRLSKEVREGKPSDMLFWVKLETSTVSNAPLIWEFCLSLSPVQHPLIETFVIIIAEQVYTVILSV